MISATTTVITDYDSKSLDEKIFLSKKPVIIKGLVDHWRLVAEGRKSDGNAINYLKSHYNGRPSVACIGPPEIQGRFFYDTEATKLKFDNQQMRVD